MNSDFAIQTFSLTKIFPDWWGRAKVIAVDKLNLAVKKNEVYGLLGPNGSGKTTTIKMLLSLLHPTSGKFSVLNGQTTDPEITARIGYLPEESFLYKYLSAGETLDFYGKLFNLPSEVRKSRTKALLEMVGLSSVASRPVGTFSKGMARRIGLAQALINDPELLILDEPTSGLDPLGTRQIKDLIITLAKRGKTILLCSHLLADVEDVCDRIGILYGGKMQCQGKVEELLRASGKKQIVIDHPDKAIIDQIQRELDGKKVNYQISSPMEKLESFFIDIVNRARENKLQTSGAVGSTKVVNFLSLEEEDKTILDELVSNDAEISSDDKSDKAVFVDKTLEAEDKALIEDLTKNEQDYQSNQAHVDKSDDVAKKTKDLENVDNDLLRDLTGEKLDVDQAEGSKENE